MDLVQILLLVHFLTWIRFLHLKNGIGIQSSAVSIWVFSVILSSLYLAGYRGTAVYRDLFDTSVGSSVVQYLKLEP